MLFIVALAALAGAAFGSIRGCYDVPFNVIDSPASRRVIEQTPAELLLAACCHRGLPTLSASPADR
jgi:hypothetical protein